MHSYTEKVIENISDKRLKDEISSELTDHIEEKAAHYMKIGYAEEDALKKAEEDMGNEPVVVANMLTCIHAYSRRSRRIKDILSLIVFVLIVIFAIRWWIIFVFSIHEKNGTIFSGCCFSALICLLLHSDRKKYAAYPFIVSLFSLTMLPFSFHVNFITTFLETISGGLADYYVNIASRDMFSGGIPFALYLFYLLTVFLSGIIIAHLSADYHNGNFGKKDLKLQKSIRKILSVLLAVTVFSTLMAIPVFFAEPDYKYDCIDGLAIIHIENKDGAQEIIERHINDVDYKEKLTEECYYAEYDYDLFETSLELKAYQNGEEAEPYFPLVKNNEQERRKPDLLTSYYVYQSSVDIVSGSGYLLIIPRIRDWSDEDGKSYYLQEEAFTVELPLEKPYNIAMNNNNEHFNLELF